MATEYFRRANIGWRWYAACGLFAAAFIGLTSGVSLTERPDVAGSDALTRAYYSLGLFVFGGLDIGTPTGGPLVGRLALWFAYFGAPLLTASAVIEAVLKLMSTRRWQLRWLQDHVVVVGGGRLTVSYLRELRRRDATVPVVVVDDEMDDVRHRELEEAFGVLVVTGDVTHDFLIRELRLGRARRVALLGDNDFLGYEAATKILARYPHLESAILLHCHNLRFQRAMEHTTLARSCVTFNSYHLAATGLVRNHLIRHFRETRTRDVVVMAGFGRFGQTVLEELENAAQGEIDTVVVIDVDADRRVLVAEEQRRMQARYTRRVMEGDISHPEVWNSLAAEIDLARNAPTVILGTGSAEDNLRTALWIKQKYPNVLVFARTNDVSKFALEVSREGGVNCISITELVEANLPDDWFV